MKKLPNDRLKLTEHGKDAVTSQCELPGDRPNAVAEASHISRQTAETRR